MELIRLEEHSVLHPSLDLFFPDSLEPSKKDLALIPNESEDAQEGGELCFKNKTYKLKKIGRAHV